jgi:predicted RNA-binding Zn-ribbon protein involved in translation (DUF1610 family)
VTHQRREEAAPAVMVRASPVTAARVAPASTGLEVSRHVTHHPCPTAGLVRCASCGRAGRFLRHDTLARVGRPQHHRRFRALP